MSAPGEDGRSEFALIDAVRARAATTWAAPGADLRVGIGDDAAVLALDAERDQVVTTDTLIEGRHFVCEGLDAADLGWKALAVSVSDVAAMGGRARFAVTSVALPAERTGEFADRLTEGLVACALAFDVALVGGDTTGSPGPVVVTTTVFGEVPRGRALLRCGARAGDVLVVTGALGGSLAGRHLRPIPRQDVALSLVQEDAVHAAIDLSDGLSSDLHHVLDASGVGAVLFADRIPIHADARRLADDRTPLEHALHDGEDFELLLAVAPACAERLERDGVAGVPLTRIGRVVADRGARLAPAADREQESTPLVRGGYDHFRDA